MPVTAGILDLVIGVPGLIVGIIWAVVGGFLTFFIAGLGALLGAPMIILSIVAIVGGVFAIRKRAWGFALAASICAFIVGLVFVVVPGLLLGIPAIVFTILGKGKFE
jgi:uncharacterized membrane protein YozB (DUF420 family)